MATGSYTPSGSLVPLFGGDRTRENVMARLTTWNGTTGANTVELRGGTLTDLPSLAGASLSAPCTVLLVPVGSTSYVIADRIRVP